MKNHNEEERSILILYSRSSTLLSSASDSITSRIPSACFGWENDCPIVPFRCAFTGKYAIELDEDRTTCIYIKKEDGQPRIV